MPNRIKRECRKLGCLSLTDNANGYCDKHQQEKFMRYDRYRKSAAQRGYNARWQRYRKIFLQKNPICANCHNAPASVVVISSRIKAIMIYFGMKLIIRRCVNAAMILKLLLKTAGLVMVF